MLWFLFTHKEIQLIFVLDHIFLVLLTLKLLNVRKLGHLIGQEKLEMTLFKDYTVYLSQTKNNYKHMSNYKKRSKKKITEMLEDNQIFSYSINFHQDHAFLNHMVLKFISSYRVLLEIFTDFMTLKKSLLLIFLILIYTKFLDTPINMLIACFNLKLKIKFMVLSQ